MPALKQNQVICHECGEVMEYDKYRTPMQNGAYYHLECLGNRATIMDAFFYSFASLFEGIDDIVKTIADNDLAPLMLERLDEFIEGKDDDDVSDDQEE